MTILFSVRHVVNSNRIIIDSEEKIDPTSIYWTLEENDSLLRISDPLYLNKTFYLTKNHQEKFKNDTAIQKELYAENIPNKGSLINLSPPFVVWKKGKNDTIMVVKDNKNLSFVKRH